MDRNVNVSSDTINLNGLLDELRVGADVGHTAELVETEYELELVKVHKNELAKEKKSEHRKEEGRRSRC